MEDYALRVSACPGDKSRSLRLRNQEGVCLNKKKPSRITAGLQMYIGDFTYLVEQVAMTFHE